MTETLTYNYNTTPVFTIKETLRYLRFIKVVISESQDKTEKSLFGGQYQHNKPLFNEF